MRTTYISHVPFVFLVIIVAVGCDRFNKVGWNGLCFVAEVELRLDEVSTYVDEMFDLDTSAFHFLHIDVLVVIIIVPSVTTATSVSAPTAVVDH